MCNECHLPSLIAGAHILLVATFITPVWSIDTRQSFARFALRRARPVDNTSKTESREAPLRNVCLRLEYSTMPKSPEPSYPRNMPKYPGSSSGQVK